jgi:hypothetical protein
MHVTHPFRSALAALLGAVVLDVGSLTFPLQVAQASAAAVTQGSQAQVDVNPNQTNPCTGAVGDLVDDERDSWTVVARGDGSSLLRGHSVARVTFDPYDASAESFSGQEVFTDVESTTRGADVVRVSQRFRLQGSAGGSITFRQTSVWVQTADGSIRVERDSGSLTCG